MRQIAGGSQSGLRKFFQQYPSLFTIEGEMVCITQTGTGKGQVRALMSLIGVKQEIFELKFSNYNNEIFEKKIVKICKMSEIFENAKS
jgi:hypothetical protein